MASSRPVIIERSRSSNGVGPVSSPGHRVFPPAPATTNQTPKRAPSRPSDGWSLDSLAGRFLEISSQAISLTAAASLIHDAQLRGEPAAWVCVGDSTFYPPDFAARGIDLSALPVMRMADTVSASRAAECLLRSGSFGVLALDLGENVNMRIPVHARLAALARKHRTAVVCLTHKGAAMPSLGPMVSLRARGALEKTGFDRFICALDVIRDRRRGRRWQHTEVCHGPDGLY